MADLPPSLSAKYVGTFAYKTVKDRLPDILTRIIDSLCRSKSEFEHTNREKVKSIIGELSKFKSEIQTGKPLKPLQDSLPDVDVWNRYLSQYSQSNKGVPPTWFNDPWLYVECYMYRKIQEIIELSGLKLDVFQKSKQQSYFDCESSIEDLSTLVYSTSSSEDIETVLQSLLYCCLWGNRCDLSISGMDTNIKVACLNQLDSLRSSVLVDNSQQFLNKLFQLKDNKRKPVRLGVILDNAGFELITDLCLIESLFNLGFVDIVHLHGKAFSWFVSDVTPEDFEWTLSQLENSKNLNSKRIGLSLRNRVSSGQIVVHYEQFWTTMFTYTEMPTSDSTLYTFLQGADVIVIKGDLNYRKLMGDLSWSFTTPLPTALRAFTPTSLLLVRTLKSEVVVGLQEGQAERLSAKSADWLVTGNYGVIQFLP